MLKKAEINEIVKKIKSLSLQAQFEEVAGINSQTGERYKNDLERFNQLSSNEEFINIGGRLAKLRCAKCSQKASKHHEWVTMNGRTSLGCENICDGFVTDNLMWIEQETKNNLTKEAK